MSKIIDGGYIKFYKQILQGLFTIRRPKLLPASKSSPADPPYVSILASIVKLLFSYCFDVPTGNLADEISSELARLLKKEREKRGFSLNVLAQRAGLSRQTVSYVEQEVQNPKLDTLLRITSVLEIHLEDIIRSARKRAVALKRPG